MLSILGFLVILGPLVCFHEFGHYLFARLFNVKAEIFSIGFGPSLWSRKIGETDWRLSMIPLGGYVKLLGEEPDADLSEADRVRSLPRQAAWKRFLIFFGGPFFNLILAVLVFMIIFAIGEPQLSSVIGRVVHGSAAEVAGFKSGDRVLNVDGKPVKRFEEILTAIADHPNQPVRFDVERVPGAIKMTVVAQPTTQQGFSVYGERTAVGEIEGLLPMSRATTLGVSDPHSPAGQAGFKTGDRFIAINGQSVLDWESFDRIYLGLPAASKVTLKAETSDGKGTHELTFVKGEGKASELESQGFYSAEMFVEKTVDKSPAASAGLKSGDRLVGVGERDVKSFFELRDAVQRAGEHDGKVTLRWERDGKLLQATVSPTVTVTRDPSLKKNTQYTVGIVPMLTWTEPETITERIWNPFLLLYKGTERMILFSYRNLVSIGKMFTGEVSIATLGGPILIGKIAGESLSRGLIAFLTTMAIISVGLGVLNLLPVPLLDGGHLVLLAIEAVRGKPLTLRQMEIVQQVGLSLILLLMVIVMRNDLARLPFFNN